MKAADSAGVVWRRANRQQWAMDQPVSPSRRVGVPSTSEDPLRPDSVGMANDAPNPAEAGLQWVRTLKRQYHQPGVREQESPPADAKESVNEG